MAEIQSTPIVGNVIAENVSEEDYFANYEGHYEWVAGKVIQMPAILISHGRIQEYLGDLFKAYFVLRPIGTIYKDPVTMRLESISSRQPLIQIVLNANPSKLHDTYLDGPADICVEIVSPGTGRTDRGEKFEEYEKGGVPEYWIIDPLRQEALFYLLNEEGVYKPQLVVDSIYSVAQLPGLKLHVPTLWQDELPNMLDILDAVKAMLAD